MVKKELRFFSVKRNPQQFWRGLSYELIYCLSDDLCTQGLYSLSGKMSYRQISWSLEAARLYVAMVVSLWNLTGTSAPQRWHLSAAEVPAKFQSDWKSLNPNLAASRLHEILR